MKKSQQIAETYLKQYVILGEQLKIIDEQMFSSSRLLLLLEEERSKETAYESDAMKEMYRNTFLRRQELNLHRVTLEGKQAAVQGVLDQLSESERRILVRFYIDGTFRLAASDLMEELGYEKSQIYRLRSRALDHVFRILQETEQLATLPDTTDG